MARRNDNGNSIAVQKYFDAVRAEFEHERSINGVLTNHFFMLLTSDVFETEDGEVFPIREPNETLPLVTTWDKYR